MILNENEAQDLIEFLSQSNYIEGVRDSESLDQALHAWKYLVLEKQLTHHVILKTHKILMNNAKIRPNERGYYRQRGAAIVREKIIGIDGDKLLVKHEKVRDVLDHKKIRPSMEQWIYIANKVLDKEDPPEFPAEWARQCHIQFETIHPFIDGNGRIGRMLLNWQRLQMNLPILIIREEERKEYYEWFK